MTKLIVDVSSVTRTNSPEDAVKLRAPEIRASKYTPGVVTTAWITVEAPEGPVDVEVEPGPIEVMIGPAKPPRTFSGSRCLTKSRSTSGSFSRVRSR